MSWWKAFRRRAGNTESQGDDVCLGTNESYREAGSLEFSKVLLREAKVAVSPGIGFGEYGEGFVRIALVENLHRTRQAIRNIKVLLSGMPRADECAMIKAVAE